MKTRFVNCIRHSRKLVDLVAILIICLFLLGCAKEPKSNSVICNLDHTSSYPKVLEQILPSYTIEQSENQAYYNLNDGAIVEAFDTQAIGALEAGIAKHWYPQYLATVIIAVDCDQSHALVNSWNDLFHIQDEVGFFYTPGDIQMLTAAMSYGSEGEDYTLTKTIELLTSLNDKSLLKVNTFEAPIIICYDYQAVSLIEQGGNIEIIIPSEGTFTYEKGLLSNEKLNFEGDLDKLLLDANLRLLDGQSKSTSYPDETAYASAIRVINHKHLAGTTQNINSIFERGVLNSKKFMSIDNREHLIFALVYMIVITIWAASVILRSMQRGIVYAAFFTGIILNGWTLVRLVKYQIETLPVLTRYLWYAFYIFQLSLPLVLLWMAWAIDKPEKETFPPKWWRILIVLISALIILVFTNDLHGYVFHLDLTRPDWGINYSYGFGYYIILFVCMMNIAVVFGILIQKSIKNTRKKGFILPILIFIIFGIYNYKYIMRDPLVYETDLTIITGIFTMLMFETCIFSGLIPVNTKYIDFFTRSPLKMQIINNNRKVALSSSTAEPLSHQVLDKVLESSPLPVLQDDFLVFANPIPGGYAIWQENVSELYQLHREIKESSNRLAETNAILAEEEKIKRAINEKNAKKQLMEQLEEEITGSIRLLTSRIEELPHSDEHSKEATSIALLLCHIKRRCNLFFKEKETNSIDPDRLISYIDEMAEIANYSNVKIATVNEIKGSLPIRYGILFYDFSYSVADFGVQGNCPYIIQHLGSEGEFYTMGFLTSKNLGRFKLESGLTSAITAAKGKIKTKDLEDTIGISISFPKGGDIYD